MTIKFFRSPGNDYAVDQIVDLDYTMEKYYVDKLYAEYVEAVQEEKPKAKRTKKEAEE